MSSPKKQGITTVNPDDVLLGRGKGSYEWKGNLKLNQFLWLYLPSYFSAEKKEKTRLTNKIVNSIKSNGGRFLKEETGKGEKTTSYRVVDDHEARIKVAQAFRHRGRMCRGEGNSFEYPASAISDAASKVYHSNFPITTSPRDKGRAAVAAAATTATIFKPPQPEPSASSFLMNRNMFLPTYQNPYPHPQAIMASAATAITAPPPPPLPMFAPLRPDLTLSVAEAAAEDCSSSRSSPSPPPPPPPPPPPDETDEEAIEETPEETAEEALEEAKQKAKEARKSPSRTTKMKGKRSSSKKVCPMSPSQPSYLLF